MSAVQTSEDIHSFNATDLFRKAEDGHTHQAALPFSFSKAKVGLRFDVKLPK